MTKGDNKDWPSIKDRKEPKKVNVKYDKHMKVMAPMKETMNYTEYLENLKNSVDPVYKVDEEAPKCPPGYRFDMKKMDCVPKSKKDSVKGKLSDQDGGRKDNKPGNTSFNVIGRTGVNGDGYAYEEPSRGLTGNEHTYHYEN